GARAVRALPRATPAAGGARGLRHGGRGARRRGGRGRAA
ncbi:MAG: hypothetical protein AVDCRST_MAG11-2407, partial [uncultured Gemmatimonadaceae bacterium]